MSRERVLLPTLLGLLWPWFLGWSVLAGVVIGFGLGDGTVEGLTANKGLQAALKGVVRYVDAVWFFLAAVNLYLWVVRREGLHVARRWGMVLLPVLAVVTWVGMRWGVPFGKFYYTNMLGWRIGEAPPVAVVLLWFTLIVCARYTVLAIWPEAQRWVVALGAGLLVVASDLLLEQVAWKMRFYWMWPDAGGALLPPVQNFVAWGVVAAALAWRLERVKGMKTRVTTQKPWRPVVILAVLNAVFLLAVVVRALRMM